MNVPPLELKDRKIISEIPPETRTILTVGCGQGRLEHYLDGYKVYATDIEPRDEMYVEFHKSDIFYLGSFPVKEADVVICSQVLEHLREYKKALRNLIRLTSNKLIITVPHKRSFDDPDHKNYWDDTGTNGFKPITDLTSAIPNSPTIKKMITKQKDLQNGSRGYLITFRKDVVDD